MFQPKKLINLLFANAQDTYYAEGLLKFEDLNRYIWYLIHKEQNYDVVYFLKERQSQFEVIGFGEKKYIPFEAKSFSLKSSHRQFSDWMRERLKDDKVKCAFVCPLKDFCNLLSRKDYETLLEELITLENSTERRGFILLTAPPVVEDSKELLLRSPVFAKHAVGKSVGCLCRPILNLRYETNEHIFDYIYDALAQQMGTACVFLNRFENGNMEALAQHLLIRENIPARDWDPESMSVYLSELLNSEEFYRGQLLREFSEDGPLEFKALYKKLCIPDNRKLVKEVYDPLRFMEGKAKAPVFYRDSGIRQCMTLKLPARFSSCTVGEKALLDMKKLLRKTKNLPMNAPILTEMGAMVTIYNEVLQSHTADETVLCILLTFLRYCAAWLYAEENSGQEKSVLTLSEDIHNYLKVREAYLTTLASRHSHSATDLAPEAWKIYEITSKQLDAKIATYEKNLDVMEAAIYAKMASVQSNVVDIDVNILNGLYGENPTTHAASGLFETFEEEKKETPQSNEAPAPFVFDGVPEFYLHAPD